MRRQHLIKIPDVPARLLRCRRVRRVSVNSLFGVD